LNLFLDSSVILAAAGSARGASRLLYDLAPRHQWNLQASSFVLGEVEHNVLRLGSEAVRNWSFLRQQLVIVPDILTVAWPTVLVPAKDRPVLFTAAAWADVLLTLDRADFGQLLGSEFYGMPIRTPGEFVRQQHDSQRHLP
jgi:predicted nucleic acid-binding protein